MKDNKKAHKDFQNINNVQNEELLEISQTDNGLEAVEKGMDYMEGDQNNSPNCGGL
ncbi:hypothetical protein [Bacillus sp. ISL-37]|jgi:hypothetical protein|uniref:hypothetical protein n=1 Tax=Bacillus sp. ISL-37 TaxID=2819123 RepID=UPI001BEB4E4D|nr:hypothetical protein [Bacillus sp. ISL-37]MBT2685039.1 hypothetical protein [Bacillus sp. ISL-37]